MAEMLLIGVDGGATEVKAHAVACDDLRQPSSFALRRESAARTYPRAPGFAPLPVTQQLAQREAGRIQLSAAEAEQGRLWVSAAAEVIVEVARQCNTRRVLVGIGMPGLKTPDARGICVINNGPRKPAYLDTLERTVRAAGVEFVSSVAALGSDADYCGLGEEYAADGLFRDVQNAYYLGGGTGLADALKLRGRLVPFDQAQAWIMKAWQMPSALGPTFETLVSAGSLNRVYANLTAVHGREGTEARRHEGTKRDVAVGLGAGRRSEPEAPARDLTADTAAVPADSRTGETPVPPDHITYPEAAAARGEPLAIAWLDTAALVLAELIFERLYTIKNGRPPVPQRGDAYAKLNPDHEYRGGVLDRVIIGQRVGLIYADPAYRAVFGDKLDTYLAAFIAASGDAEMAAQCAGAPFRSGGRSGPTDGVGDGSPVPTLRPGFLCASRLRAAPALGAAVAAVRAL